jgi:hypothetical protein
LEIIQVKIMSKTGRVGEHWLSDWSNVAGFKTVDLEVGTCYAAILVGGRVYEQTNVLKGPAVEIDTHRTKHPLQFLSPHRIYILRGAPTTALL